MIKKFLCVLLAMLSLSCNCNALQELKSDIIFVPDEKITIDSSCISENLYSSDKRKLRFIPVEGELFPNDSLPKIEDIKQGKLGICYFLSVLSSLVQKDPKSVKDNIYEDQDGNIVVKFFNPRNNGKPLFIKVQKTIPELPNRYKFLNSDSLWLNLYLKAFVASGFSGLLSNNYLDYKSAEGGRMEYVMEVLIGKESQYYGSFRIWLMGKETFYLNIKKILDEGGFINCDFNPNAIKFFAKIISDDGFDKGIVYRHAYSIESIYEKDGQKWITIKNPWGGYGSTYDNNGNRVLDTADFKNGRSDLKFEDFYDCCGGISFTCKNEFKGRSFLNKIFSLALSSVPNMLLLLGATVAGYYALDKLDLGVKLCK